AGTPQCLDLLSDMPQLPFEPREILDVDLCVELALARGDFRKGAAQARRALRSVPGSLVGRILLRAIAERRRDRCQPVEPRIEVPERLDKSVARGLALRNELVRHRFETGLDGLQCASHVRSGALPRSGLT